MAYIISKGYMHPLRNPFVVGITEHVNRIHWRRINLRNPRRSPAVFADYRGSGHPDALQRQSRNLPSPSDALQFGANEFNRGSSPKFMRPLFRKRVFSRVIYQPAFNIYFTEFHDNPSIISREVAARLLLSLVQQPFTISRKYFSFLPGISNCRVSLINSISWKSDFIINSRNMSDFSPDRRLATLLPSHFVNRENVYRNPACQKWFAEERNVRVLIQLPETLDKTGRYRKIVVTKIMIDFVSDRTRYRYGGHAGCSDKGNTIIGQSMSTSRHSTSRRSFSIARKWEVIATSIRRRPFDLAGLSVFYRSKPLSKTEYQ